MSREELLHEFAHLIESHGGLTHESAEEIRKLVDAHDPGGLSSHEPHISEEYANYFYDEDEDELWCG